ncbi:hypothetical protein PTSG_00050 [Salpingoeca rosetta]|uniref:Translation initiation factor beta propellor-like domain-containing protein n=1 Tax=Salpingoeca rosetta (strain ATCC 50818 / BSB-021) TaxID=946362 RepID=F2TVD7_SALR5|nr:uncharacterized protein PTSG_00050 [Salpingoeca rosetta]EGD72033.1 hypothetical protein PTSG_00050 [Salpingoeca rosetta]|eukprot:XP_004998605.1 hypothetical protein PTSG_00050 [Salpingoeca rosetta]
MDFSQPMRCAPKQPPLCSPNGEHIALGIDNKLIIRRASDAAVVRTQACKDAINYLEWSSDSQYLITANFQRALVEIWALDDVEWECRIDEGAAGLESVRWSPDGRHVLTTAQFQLRVTIWSLVAQQTHYFKFPKFAGKGLGFTSNGKFMAVLERSEGRDFVSIITCESWQVVRRFQTETSDATDLTWSPDDHHLCIWDSPLTYTACVYSISGKLLRTFSAYSDALGIKSVAWAPSSQLLAIGSYDQKVRLLNNVIWSEIIDFKHTQTVTSTANRVVYAEIGAPAAEAAAKDIAHASSQYELISGSYKFNALKLDSEKPNPRLGVGWMAFSSDSRFLASRNDNMPNTLFIWTVAKLRLTAALHQLAAIRCAAWHPTRPLLALCCGQGQVYFWSTAGALALRIPAKGTFAASFLSWSPEGNTLLISGSKGFVMCDIAQFLSTNSDLA